MDSLPLFPLGTVLLPGVPCALQVFEPRYVALVTHLTRTGADEFGVVAIRRGREVGADRPDLAPVGCTARIVDRVREDDRILLQTVGGRRFRIQEIHDDVAPYLVADVSWPDPAVEAPVPADLPGRTVEAFAAFTAAVGARVDGLPVEVPALTAAVLDGLGLPLADRQRVLEAGDAAARLDAVRRLCLRERGIAEVLHCRSARVTPSARLSPN